MAQLPGRVGLQRRGGAKAIAVVVANSGAQIDRLAEPAPPFGHQRGGLAGAPLIGGAEILAVRRLQSFELVLDGHCQPMAGVRSDEHTSEIQSLMRSSYAVFCLKTKISLTQHNT